MYRNCMFCAKPLGANAVVETFPVGRRLAFDAARGRLWVVCRKCERWNLTPIEERWEAVEDCERIFRDTRVRVSTDNIGLARHPEGLTLVRIGRPMRPEFAAWRYGDQFGRRLRRAVLYGAGAAAVGTALVTTGVGASWLGLGLVINEAHLRWVHWRTVVKLRPDEGAAIKLKAPDARNTRILPGDDGEGFGVEISEGEKTTQHNGDEAKRFVGAILPKLNVSGGTRKTVRRAVNRIETAGHPDAFLADVARRGFPLIHSTPMATWVLRDSPHNTIQLALEMALHEEQERRAMEGELWLLERAWEEAEEIAAISDNLLLPEGAEEFIREHGGEAKHGGSGDGSPSASVDWRRGAGAASRPQEHPRSTRRMRRV